MANIKGILGVASVGLMLFTMYEQNKTINTLKDTVRELKSQNKSDSLQTELFNSQSENGRYELSLEHLKEVDPKAAKEFENFKDTQTE
jgi:hypothetical protein